MLVLCIIFLCLSTEIAVSQKLSNDNLKLTDILPADYSRDRAPILDGKPVEVKVEIYVLSLIPGPNTDMSFDVDLFYYLYWNDYRLIHLSNSTKKVVLSSEWKDRLWIPDTYFRNAISGGISNVMSPSLYFTVTNGTNLLMTARLKMKMSCYMNFKKYPFDTQTCFINITMLSESAEIVRLNWYSFRMGSHIYLPEFGIAYQSKGVCTKYFDIGTYSCLYVVIQLSRNIGNYIIKRFAPSFLIVVMTFIGFWIPTSIAPARVSLIITALLALITQQIQAELNVSYVYALEVWTGICILFVFATLLEYAIAIAWPLDEKTSTRQSNLFVNNENSKRWFTFLSVKPGPRNCSVDIVSRILFPLIFGATVIVYSVAYYFA